MKTITDKELQEVLKDPVGSFPAGQESEAVALIEAIDGSLTNVSAPRVKFTDVEGN